MYLNQSGPSPVPLKLNTDSNNVLLAGAHSGVVFRRAANRLLTYFQVSPNRDMKKRFGLLTRASLDRRV